MADSGQSTIDISRNKSINYCANYLRQYRDLTTGDFKKIKASQFMDVWNHYDEDGNGFIDGKELNNFLFELVTSVTQSDCGTEVISEVAFDDAKTLFMSAFDENHDGKIDIRELAQLLPMEEKFLLLFRRDHPVESSVEFMQKFLRHLLKQSNREATEDELICYAETILKLFDRNNDGKLQLSEMAKLLPVKENFLCRPMFKGDKALTKEDLDRVFSLYDRDKNGTIENEELHGFLKDLMDLIEEDYNTEDIEDSKRVLLEQCDLNRDGKINKNELTMLLMSYDQVRLNTTDPLK